MMSPYLLGFDQLVNYLDSSEAAGLAHAELETQLDTRGREASSSC